MASVVFGGITYGASVARVVYGRRVWSAHVTMLDPVEMPMFSNVIAEIGGLELRGSVVAGKPVLGRASYSIVGGAGLLRLPVAPTSLRSDGGVRRATKLKHLFDAVNEVGRKAGASGVETFVLDGADAIDGKAWAPIAGAGTELLGLIAGKSWYVDTNGATRVFSSNAVVLDALKYTIQDPDPTLGTCTIAPTSTDDMTAIFNAVGGSIVGDPLEAPLVVGSIRAIETDVLRLYISP